MAYHKTPQKFRLDIIISMDYSIAGVYYRPCIRNLNLCIYLPYSIDRFPHYLYFPLHYAFSHHVFLKHIIPSRKILETDM